MKNPKLIRARMGASFVCDITLLDLFAGMIICGHLSNVGGLRKEDVEEFARKLPAAAYELARAMLKEREKHFLQMKVKGENDA